MTTFVDGPEPFAETLHLGVQRNPYVKFRRISPMVYGGDAIKK